MLLPRLHTQASWQAEKKRERDEEREKTKETWGNKSACESLRGHQNRRPAEQKRLSSLGRGEQARPPAGQPSCDQVQGPSLNGGHFTTVTRVTEDGMPKAIVSYASEPMSPKEGKKSEP